MDRLEVKKQKARVELGKGEKELEYRAEPSTEMDEGQTGRLATRQPGREYSSKHALLPLPARRRSPREIVSHQRISRGPEAKGSAPSSSQSRLNSPCLPSALPSLVLPLGRAEVCSRERFALPRCRSPSLRLFSPVSRVRYLLVARLSARKQQEIRSSLYLP